MTGAPPALSSAAFVMVRYATGPTSCVKPVLLLDRSGSPVFELIPAASAIVCPAVPPANVPVIVIVAVVLAAIVPSVQTNVPPVVGNGVQAAPEAPVAVNWLGRVSLTTTCSAASGPSLVAVSV